MDYEELEKLLKISRTTRKFKANQNITSQDLKELINLARLTSSAKNMQPIKYITVTNQEHVKALASSCKWASHLKDFEQKEDERPSAFILMLNDQMIDGYPLFDSGASFTAISLAAKTKGLSTAALASIDKDLCRKLFVIPDCYDVMIGIAIGIQNEEIKLLDTDEFNTQYYKDEKGTHIVPKRDLKQIIVGEY